MHYLFVDEAYHDLADGRAVVVGAWATEQAKLNDRLQVVDELRQRGKSPILTRIVSALESLEALALVARAELAASVFRSGEINGTNDIPTMARADNIWSMSVIFAVGSLVQQLAVTRHDVRTVDIYFDPRSLKTHHAAAVERALRELLVPEARRFGIQLGTDRLKEFRIRRVQPVEKPKNDPPTKFQNGTWVSHQLCAKSDQIISAGGMPRIKVQDMSDEIRRTVQQFDGKPYYE